jgi:hypothetical protein
MSTAALRERHIDRLISEELQSSTVFLSWLLKRALGPTSPDGDVADCSTTIGHHRQDGETDVLLRVTWASGQSGVVHIEDKITAQPQPNQGSRYAVAVKQEVATVAASILVAPHAWLQRHPREAAKYDATLQFEEIAEHFKTRADAVARVPSAHSKELVQRLRWREQIFSGAQQRANVLQAITSGELTDWNTAAAEVIRAENGLSLDVADRQASAGTTKASRFILFNETLTEYENGQSPRLKLKTAERETPGRVSLEVRKAADDEKLQAEASATGYAVAITPTGTVVISDSTSNLGRLDIAKPVAEQVGALKDAARLAQRLVEWWEQRAAGHSPRV